jgi:hypothetical protein
VCTKAHARSHQGIAAAAHTGEQVITAVLACVAVVLALTLAHPSFIGHDDGIYAALGASLARHGDYRLINLPSQPPETKYPPLYPALLAAVWLAVPNAPGNVLALKAVNALVLGVLAGLYWLLLRRVGHLTPVDRILGVAVFISLPGVFSFSDLLVSEPLFLGLLILLLLAVPPAGTPPSVRRLIGLGIVAGAAVLTRTVGVALVAGTAWHMWRSAGVRPAAIVLAAAAAVVAPWLLWRSVVFDSTAGPLEMYYLVYETSAWQWVIRDPLFAFRVIATNVGAYVHGVPIVFGLYAGPVLILAGMAVVAGAWTYPRAERALLGRITACYCLLILGHPLPMERYLVPVIPIAALLLTAGGACARTFLARRRMLSELAAIVPLAALLAGNLAWLQHCAVTRAQGPQWHFGRRAAVAWSGFEEVFAWLDAHTTTDAVIASAFDPVYFIYTGRRAVRPWVHQPERYAPAYEAGGLPDSSAPVVAAALDALGVEYLIVDPMEGSGEGEHARNTIRALLTDSSRWVLVFETSNRAHRVYRKVSREHSAHRAGGITLSHYLQPASGPVQREELQQSRHACG